MTRRPLKAPSRPSRVKSKVLRKKSFSFLGIVKWLSILFIWAGVIGGSGLLWFSYDLPDLRQLEQSTRLPGITLLARDGSLIATYGDLYGSAVRLKDLPPYVPQAIMAIEDRRFYDHFGIDVLGVIRAAWVNYRAGHVVQGGSTLTQQLAKNLLISEKLYTPADRSFRRKIQELILACKLEQELKKEQILAIYLNRVYLGAGVFGVEAAAQKYFGKSAKKLTLYEAAVIAGLLKAPSKYSPLSNPKLAHERAEVVLAQMARAGFITEVQRAQTQPLVENLHQAHEKMQKGRYFSDWIFDSLADLVGQRHEDLIVKTTLDLKLQNEAETHVKHLIETEGRKHKASEAALLSMTPSGAVLSMVGGVNYFQSQFNRAVQAKRQAGSAFKLFIYLAALEQGMTPDSLMLDAPIQIGGWKPRNYTRKFQGEVSLRTSFAHSLNTVSVRLAKRIGYGRIQEMARRLGLLSPQPKDLTLALGTGDTTLLELTAAYAVIANYGFHVTPYGIQEVRTKEGKLLYRHSKESAKRLLQARQVQQMMILLKEVMHSGTGRTSALSRPSAGKTGTTQNYKDAWFIGFTPDLITGVWLGNDQNQPMKDVTGGKLAAQLWHTYMEAIHQGKPVRYFP